MIRTKTTFVIGAGASCEFRLPSGDQLKGEIAKSLSIAFADGYRLSSGAPHVVDAMRQIASQRGIGDINPLLTAGWKIRDAMVLAPSIDNFVHTHRDDSLIVECAKLGIVNSIFAAERSSLMPKYEPGDQKALDFSRINDTWIVKLWQMIAEGVGKSGVREMFNNISFIVFNYDRCLEHFLFWSLKYYFGIEDDEAKNIVAEINILHPYGSLGPLTWQDKEGGVAFGAKSIPYASSIEKIKTFTESEAEIPEIENILASSESVVFLGFSYMDLNMKLLRPKRRSDVKTIFGTAYGISDYNTEIIRNDLAKINSGQIYIKNNLKCRDLLDEYSRGIAT